MLAVRLVTGVSLIALIACSAARDDQSGTGPSGGAGGSGGSGFGGSGAATNEAPELAEGQRDQQSMGDPAYGAGAAGGSAPANLSGACANLQQNNHVVSATVAGSNSTGSAVEAKEALEQSTPIAPIPSHVSMQDFLSHYRPDFPPLTDSSPVAHIQLKQTAVPTDFDLLVALQAPPYQGEAPRVSLTIVVDNTESMGDGLERAKHALKAIAGDLKAGDTVQWLTAEPESEALPLAIAGPGDPALIGAIDALGLETERDLAPLIDQAYSIATGSYAAGGMNRILLVSDGASDPGALPATIAESAGDTANEIRLTALGAGSARDNGHRFLRTASRFGRGAYRYLDSTAAGDALAGRFHELFGVAMDNVSLALDIPWYFTIERPFIGGVSNTSVPIEPQYVAPDGSMTFLFRLIACSDTAYKDIGGSVGAEFAWTSPVDGTPQLTTHSVPVPSAVLDQNHGDLLKMLAVASYAEALRSLDQKRLNNALSLAQLDPGNEDLIEIAGLIQKHPVLLPAASP